MCNAPVHGTKAVQEGSQADNNNRRSVAEEIATRGRSGEETERGGEHEHGRNRSYIRHYHSGSV